MMKKLALMALAIALVTGAAAAYELQRNTLTGETAPAPYPPSVDGGYVVISNYDWIPFYIEVHHRRGVLRIRKTDEAHRNNSILLNPGAQTSIPSDQRIWTMEGNNGRSITVGVRSGRNVNVDLVPDGDSDMIGTEAIVHSRRHQESQLLMAWQNRPRYQWPQAPAPIPYIEPVPVPYIEPSPIPVIVQEPYPVYVPEPQPYYYPPVIDPPHYSPPPQIPPQRPHYDPPVARPPVYQPPVQRPPAYQPPIQRPPAHRPPIQLPPQHTNNPMTHYR